MGFGAAGHRTCRLLADLFVLPDRQGQGVGRRLLDAVLAGTPGRGRRSPRTIRARSALYVRAGMRPCWPNLYLSGGRRAGSTRTTDAGIASGAGDRGRERADWSGWTGIDRTDGPRLLGDAARRSGHVIRRRAGDVVGVGVGRATPDGGRVAGCTTRCGARRRRPAGPAGDPAGLPAGRPTVGAAVSPGRSRSSAACWSGASGSSTATRSGHGSRSSLGPRERILPESRAIARAGPGSGVVASRTGRARLGLGGDRDRLLDRHADEAAVLGPRAVVVADPLVAEQLVQHEPVCDERSPMRQ